MCENSSLQFTALVVLQLNKKKKKSAETINSVLILKLSYLCTNNNNKIRRDANKSAFFFMSGLIYTLMNSTSTLWQLCEKNKPVND